VAIRRKTQDILRSRRINMPRGDKSKYTPKQKRKAEHIEESYESRGLDAREAEARAWATVNKQSGGGERSGSGRKTAPQKKAAARRNSARRAVATKHGHSPNRGRMTRRPAGPASR
jgi:plasmid stabilization system protein ParE